MCRVWALTACVWVTDSLKRIILQSRSNEYSAKFSRKNVGHFVCRIYHYMLVFALDIRTICGFVTDNYVCPKIKHKVCHGDVVWHVLLEDKNDGFTEALSSFSFMHRDVWQVHPLWLPRCWTWVQQVEGLARVSKLREGGRLEPGEWSCSDTLPTRTYISYKGRLILKCILWHRRIFWKYSTR